MSEFRTRISRVRMKGGADVHILNCLPDGAEDFRGDVVNNARILAENATGAAPLVGYFIIGFYGDGAHSCGYRMDHQKCPVPATLMPAYINEIIRKHSVTGQQACDVFNEMFQWVE